MKLVSILEIHRLLGTDRETITKRLASLIPKDGPKRAKLYPSDKALRLVLGREEETETDYIDNAEAQRLLTIKRGQQIDLEMEVTRKQRIPLETLEEINDTAFSNVAGMIKAHEGKTLTSQAIGDMLGELRTVGHAIREVSR